MKILIAMLKNHKTDTFLCQGNLEKLEAKYQENLDGVLAALAKFN